MLTPQQQWCLIDTTNYREITVKSKHVALQSDSFCAAACVSPFYSSVSAAAAFTREFISLQRDKVVTSFSFAMFRS